MKIPLPPSLQDIVNLRNIWMGNLAYQLLRPVVLLNRIAGAVYRQPRLND